MIRLPAAGPLDWSGMLEFFRRRAIPGIETVSDTTYRRTVCGGWVEAISSDGARELALSLSGLAEPETSARIARMFDLAADTERIARHIGFPHAWLPGCWDPFELAIRAILGQQISVAAARTFAGRIVSQFGHGEFPSAEVLYAADLTRIGLTRARAFTIRLLAEAVYSGDMDYGFHALTRIPGIGPWTAHYIAMRALKNGDAFPSSDLVLRKVLGLTEKQLIARAEAWRPWRAYAVIQIWRSAT